MNIKYVSLLSLIFVANLALNNTMMAMKTSKKNIQSEMLIIDQKIEALDKDLKIEIKQTNKIIEINKEKEQRDKDKRQIANNLQKINQNYFDCLNQQKIDVATLYFWQPYTTDCNSLHQEFDKAHRENTKNAMEKNAKNAMEKIDEYLIDENKELEHVILITKNITQYTKNITQYLLFKDNFKRCELLNDIVCFKDLEKELYEWNKNN